MGVIAHPKILSDWGGGGKRRGGRRGGRREGGRGSAAGQCFAVVMQSDASGIFKAGLGREDLADGGGCTHWSCAKHPFFMEMNECKGAIRCWMGGGRRTEAAFNALRWLPSFREQDRERVLVLVVVEVLPNELVNDEVLVRHGRLGILLRM